MTKPNLTLNPIGDRNRAVGQPNPNQILHSILVVLCLLAPFSLSAASVFMSAEPNSGPKGLTVTVTAPGWNLSNVTHASLGESQSNPRVEVENPDISIVEFVIPDMPTGTYRIQLWNSSTVGTPQYSSSQQIFTVTPTVAPEITSPLAVNATNGVPFSYEITATNFPTGFSAAPLPPGLNVTPSTGKITGTPTQTGDFNVTLSASNDAGTGSAVLSLTVQPPVPVITSDLADTTLVNQPYSYQITAVNNPTRFDADGLPSGLNIDTATGLISGTPTRAGSFNVTLSAGNDTGTGTATLNLNVALPPVPEITSPREATELIGEPFFYQIEATHDPTQFGATNLPPGLDVEVATGEITGIPEETGVFEATISAVNIAGTNTAPLTVTIESPIPPEITSKTTDTGVVGQPYSYRITADNNPTSFGAGGLPDGLSVHSDTGVISGVPEENGSFNVTLSASNLGGSGTATLALTILPPRPRITGDLSVHALVDEPFEYQIAASNNPTSFNAAPMPDGLSLNASGLISGTPVRAGIHNITLEATNAGGTGTAVLKLTISEPNNAPVLRVVPRANRRLELSWSTAATGFGVQFTEALDGAAAWQDLPQSPEEQGDRFVLTLDPTGSARFFRLQKAE